MIKKDINKNILLEIKTVNGYKLLNINNIIYVKSEGKLCLVFLENQSSLIAYHLLKWFEQHLTNPTYFRCHNSFLINNYFVECYYKHLIILKWNHKIPISRTRKVSFIKNLRAFLILTE